MKPTELHRDDRSNLFRSERTRDTTMVDEVDNPGASQEAVIDSQETIPNDSQDFPVAPLIRKNYWGFLFPAASIRGLFPYDFSDHEEYLIGRAASQEGAPHKILLPVFEPKSVHDRTSRSQFAIRRIGDRIYFRNLSKKGTYVNFKLIIDQEWHILANPAEISPVLNEPLFTFNGLCDDDVSTEFPEEVSADFLIGKKLGEGSFGKVFMAYRRVRTMAEDDVLAMKVVARWNGKSIDADSQRRAVEEAALLKSLSHVNIVKFHDARLVEYDVYIFVEYMAGGELYDRLDVAEYYKLGEELTVKVFFYQAASALLYLHSRGIAHRDVKAENMLLKTKEVYTILKLADFGMGRFAEKKKKMVTWCGTPGYMAPELIRNQAYTLEVDSWSLGVVLYLLLCNHPPFPDKEDDRTKQMILEGRYVRSEPYRVNSAAARELVGKLMEVDPQKRFSPYQALEHKWLADAKMDAILSPLLWNNGPRPPVVEPQSVYMHQETRPREPLSSIQEQLPQSRLYQYVDGKREYIERPEAPDGPDDIQPFQKKPKVDQCPYLRE